MKNCVFCKIIKSEIDSAKIWENRDFLAILDVQPNTKGMTLVLSKKHYNSDVWQMSNKVYQKFMLAGQKVAKILKKGLKVERVALVMEGLGVNHAHLKLYPLHGLDKKFKAIWAPKKTFFSRYPGYLSTQIGPAVNLKTLKSLAKKIQSFS